MQRGIVWVVDDDSSIRWVLERALTGAGLSCTTFESGSEVLDALTTKTPDVLLSDIRMPGMDGLALFERIQSQWLGMPVIIMTAHGTIPDAIQATRSGVFSFLTKPIDKDELPLLFDRFHKADKSRSADREGWGLGLYIAKTIVGAHGGDIWATSENGVTQFNFTLPTVR